MKLNSKKLLKPWQLVKSEYLLKDQWLTLRADTCLTSDGTTIEPYYVFELPDWVHVVVINDQGKVMVVWQYRHAVRAISLGLPAGWVAKSDENPLAAARRELLEETGFTGNFVLAGTTSPNPATHTNPIFTFLVTHPKQISQPITDPSEEITHEFITQEQLWKLIDKGKFSHALYISSLILALRKLKH